MFDLCCFWLCFRNSGGRTPGCQVTWTPGRKGGFVATLYNFRPCSSQVGFPGSRWRDRCLARRSLTATGGRPAGGSQQRFGDVGRWCHKLSSESKVREVPSSPPPTPVQCRAVPQVLQKRLHSSCMPRCGKLLLWSWLREKPTSRASCYSP